MQQHSGFTGVRIVNDACWCKQTIRKQRNEENAPDTDRYKREMRYKVIRRHKAQMQLLFFNPTAQNALVQLCCTYHRPS